MNIITKKKLNIFPVCAVLASLTFFNMSNVTQAAAMYDAAFWPCKGFPTNVYADMKHYVDQSVTDLGYGWINQSARNGWDKITDADVGYGRVFDYQSADTRAFAGYYTWADYSGLMQAYYSNGSKVPDADYLRPETPFYKAHVLLNDYIMDELLYSDNERLKTAIHEWGHVMKLAHQSPPSSNNGVWDSVMITGQFSMLAPSWADEQNVKWKY
ncbi:hypothetical protein [Paenibacillus lutrae]|uniref:Peptidase M10 metallopeptidase domain-containing protein n=1 Tax=Paenibacillus lutrae TaxID=2078573 RepID=A0A7X3K0R2_9BACL|nr:hypothetical protein [Paenibacillus lutrae]MVP01372.1 hypothetical protein [Paenibacillus lutrae]